MNKAETIAKYGEAAYEKQLEQRRARYKAHKEEEYREKVKACKKKYKEDHKEEVNGKMNTRQINVSFVVNVDGHVALRDMEMNWIVSDDAETIAEDIKEAILNIE